MKPCIATLPPSVMAPIARRPGLADPYLKLGRAKMHLDALGALLKQFTGPKAYTVRRYEDLEQKRHCFECKLLDVPDGVCLTVGDAFYNMRSCLDQIVWSLAGLASINPPAETTQFPIFNSPPTKTKDVRRWNRQLAGVAPKAVEEIKSFQPYRRGKSYKAHPLWRLNALCNLDKHRRIPANGSEVVVTFPNITKGDVIGLQSRDGAVSKRNPLDFRIEAFDDRHVVSVPLADKAKLQLNPSITFKVNFGQGDAWHPDALTICEDSKGLWEIYNFVADIVLPRFLRFFP